MMGRTHALSGAAGWITGCAALTAAGHTPDLRTVAFGSAIAAGHALLPDIDHPGSTIARSLGPVTRIVAAGVHRFAAWLRTASCGHCRRRPDRGGHRAVTHTGLFAFAAGLCAGLLGWLSGWVAAAFVVGLSAALAVRAMTSRRQRGAFGAAAAGLLSGGALWVTSADVASWWWIGVPVAWGTLAHSLGDAVTKSGAPLLWPVRVRGCRWWGVGTPRWMRFRTGGGVERVVWVLLLVGAVGGFGCLVVAA